MSLDEGSNSHESILTIDGIITESPINIASPDFNEGSESVIPDKESGKSLLTKFWSSGFVKRIATKLLHCEKIVSDISDGLWLITASVTPYFLPSFAILSIDKVELLYLTKLLLGAYLWASS